MRDPARVQRMLDKLTKLWYSNPDQRFGQLVESVLHDYMVGPFKPEGPDHRCVYYLEDDKAEAMLDDALSADGSPE